MSQDKPFQPFSLNHYRNRLRSFTQTRWFSKPPSLDPFQIALYGWFNSQMDTIECRICESRLAFQCSSFSHSLIGRGSSQLESRILKFIEFYKLSGHSSSCPWRLTHSPEHFCTLPVPDVTSWVQSLVNQVLSQSGFHSGILNNISLSIFPFPTITVTSSILSFSTRYCNSLRVLLSLYSNPDDPASFLRFPLLNIHSRCLQYISRYPILQQFFHNLYSFHINSESQHVKFGLDSILDSFNSSRSQFAIHTNPADSFYIGKGLFDDTQLRKGDQDDHTLQGHIINHTALEWVCFFLALTGWYLSSDFDSSVPLPLNPKKRNRDYGSPNTAFEPPRFQSSSFSSSSSPIIHLICEFDELYIPIVVNNAVPHYLDIFHLHRPRSPWIYPQPCEDDFSSLRPFDQFT